MALIFEYELETRFEEYLNEVYGTVSICGHDYDAARALKEVDPTAFRCGFSDWLDGEIGVTIKEVDGEYYDIDDEIEIEGEA